MKVFELLRIYQPRETGLLGGTGRRLRPSTILLHAALIFFCLIVLLPIAWLFLLSVKSVPDAYTGTLWPQRFDFTHYGFVFEHVPTLTQNMTNSIVVTVTTVVLTSTCAVLAGYALVHLRLPGRGLVVIILVASLFFPTRLVALIGIFDMHSKLHLLNTLIGLILPYVSLNLVVSVLIMRGVFQQISPEIVDAARIDGSSSWHTLWAVLLPLVRNGIVILIIANFITAWGEYLLASTLIDDQVLRTMPPVLTSRLSGLGEFALPRAAAIYMLYITPGIIGFAIVQRRFMKGLIEGALNA